MTSRVDTRCPHCGRYFAQHAGRTCYPPPAELPLETADERDRNAKQAELLRKVRNSVPGLKV